MKHIFILQGKKYISSKRASKVSDYSSDYIGQLCRAGKLDCKMVGHTWFVTENSLLKHADTVVAKERYQNRAKVFSIASDSTSSRKTVSAGDSINAYLISTKDAAAKTGYTSDYIGQLCRSGKLDGRRIGNIWFVSQSSLDTHLEKRAHEEQSKKVLQLPAPRARVSTAALLPVQKVSASKKIPAAKTSRRPSTFSILSSKKGIIFAALFVFAVITTFSTLNAPNSSTQISSKDQVASVGVNKIIDAIDYLFDSIYVSLKTALQHVSGLAVHEPKEIPAANAQNNFSMAVAPSAGSQSADEAQKEAIKNSFSDEVEVHPDQSGTAGIITPVFRKTKGNDFVYVLVPVKNASAP